MILYDDWWLMYVTNSLVQCKRLIENEVEAAAAAPHISWWGHLTKHHLRPVSQCETARCPPLLTYSWLQELNEWLLNDRVRVRVSKKNQTTSLHCSTEWGWKLKLIVDANDITEVKFKYSKIWQSNSQTQTQTSNHTENLRTHTFWMQTMASMTPKNSILPMPLVCVDGPEAQWLAPGLDRSHATDVNHEFWITVCLWIRNHQLTIDHQSEWFKENSHTYIKLHTYHFTSIENYIPSILSSSTLNGSTKTGFNFNFQLLHYSIVSAQRHNSSLLLVGDYKLRLRRLSLFWW